MAVSSGAPPSRASARALEIEDKMLVLRIRRSLAQGEFAAELGREWLRDMSMVSDLDFGGIARRLRREQATVRTRLAARGVAPEVLLDDLMRRLPPAIESLDELARQYREFESSNQAATSLPQAADQARQQLAKARRTIATLNKRRGQLQTTIDAPASRGSGGHGAPNGAEREANAKGEGVEERKPSSFSGALEGAAQLWARINPTARGNGVRRALDDEARALRISREELEKVQQGLFELSANQETRSAALSEDSARFVLEEMGNAKQSVAKLQTELVVKLLDVNLQRAFAYLSDELRQALAGAALDSQPGSTDEQLISYAQSFVQLDRRHESRKREVAAGALGGTDASILQLERDVQDFLLVLGLTSPTVDAVEWDLSRTQGAVKSNMDKLSAGVAFYLRGVRLIAQDSWFSLGLLSQAISGQTLSEREARILQRTARDLVTFVPFVIILIIPLSPPGHVLVFSLIQRIFPDFFPSAFSERRQQLIDTYQRLASEGGQPKLTGGGREAARAGEGESAGNVAEVTIEP